MPKKTPLHTPSVERQLANQGIALDYGDEVPYAFDYLPINRRLNQEMFERAVERAKRVNG